MDFQACSSRFDELYAAHSGDVYGYAVRRGATQADAEDVVVETFLVCWRRMGDVPEQALPWLLGVARRVLANQRRGKKRYLALRRKITATLHREPSEAPDPPSDSYGLKEALASLRDEDREVLALVAWQDLTHEEAAAVMGCSRNALTKRYLKACRNLRAQLPPDWTYTKRDRSGSSTADADSAPDVDRGPTQR